MREGLSVSVCRHWHQTLCKLLQSETLRWWALQRGTYYWAERKWMFSLSQMSNDELAQSLPWRENEGWNPTFSLSQMGKASLLVVCHGEKRCMKWPILWGVVNRVSSHVKSRCRTVLATSNAITCLWHCGMRHRVWRAVWEETFTHGSVRGWGLNSLALLDLWPFFGYIKKFHSNMPLSERNLVHSRHCYYSCLSFRR